MKEIKYTKNFYSMFDGMYNKKKYGVPKAPDKFSHMDIPKHAHQENWRPISFKKLKEEGPLPDYVSTDICGRICSSKLKLIIQEHLTKDDDEIQWLPMLIEDEETGENEEYYYLHFPKVCDTLNKEKTFFSPSGIPAVSVFDFEKVKNRSIFNCPKGESYTVISKKLKEAIFKAGCTGLKVEPANVIQVIAESQVS